MYKNAPLPERPLAVVFDLSGTLIDSQKIDREALDHVLKAYGLPAWSETRKKRDSSKSIKENFPIFFGADADEAYEQYIAYLLAHKDQMSLFTGAKETLQFLKDAGVPVIIVSNRDKQFVADTLKEFGLESFVSIAIGAGDTVYSKPDKRLLEFALEAAQISSCGKNVLFVGDALADMNCAEASQAFPVLLRAAKTDITDEWIRQAEKDGKVMWVVKDYTDFLSLLKSSVADKTADAVKNHPPKKGPDGPG